MICIPCSDAGQFNAEANRVAAVGPGGRHLRKLAEQNHKDCPGGNWCDCQHYVGQAVSQLAVAGESQADVLEPVE